MPNDSVTRSEVLEALAEFDQLGREAFLATYGFRPATAYMLVHGGRSYDSKAVYAVAHQYLPGGHALRWNELYGGKGGAAGRLVALGFEVTEPDQNPNWSWDEHVLALELYFQNPASPPGKDSPQIRELSELLNQLADINEVEHNAKYRNANGVYMKLMNFRRLDPVFQAQKKRGLTRGAEGETVVWERYANDPDGLKLAADLIRTSITIPILPIATLPDDENDDLEGAEGSAIVRTHVVRERNKRLVQQKKAEVLKRTGQLGCECCSFDFLQVYGEIGEGFAEVHHIDPLALSMPDRKTKLSELAIVCANCHRMLHRGGLISLEELRAKLLW